jgi:hypothetical protein
VSKIQELTIVQDGVTQLALSVKSFEVVHSIETKYLTASFDNTSSAPKSFMFYFLGILSYV